MTSHLKSKVSQFYPSQYRIDNTVYRTRYAFGKNQRWESCIYSHILTLINHDKFQFTVITAVYVPQVSRSIGHRHLCDIDFTLIILKVIHGQNFHAILPLEMRRKSKCILAIYCAVLLLTISGFNKCWINNPKSNWKMGPSLVLMVIYQMRCGHNEFVWFPNPTSKLNRDLF